MGQKPTSQRFLRELEDRMLKCAVAAHPNDDKEWRKKRGEWKVSLCRSNLTPAMKLVGIVIADCTINRDPRNKKFGTGWASIETLASWSNCSERTVSTALKGLYRGCWIALRSGKGPGNSNQYTIRLDAIVSDQKNEVVSEALSEQVKILQVLPEAPALGYTKKEKLAGQTGNLRPPNTKNLQTNPMKPEEALRATASDHHRLALAVGEGNVEQGWLAMEHVDQAQIDEVAVALRDNGMTEEEVKNRLRPIALTHPISREPH